MPRGEWNFITHQGLDPEQWDEGILPSFDGYLPIYQRSSDTDYVRYLSQSFAFFRRHASGRYSDSTLMRLARAHDFVGESGLPDNWADSERSSLPTLAVAEVTSRYDEDTEEKFGGIVAMAAIWPQMDDRAILAVHRSFRERGVGAGMVKITRNLRGGAHFWVGRHNTAGQRLLSGQGLFPTVISPSGAIRYATATIDCDEEDGGFDDPMPAPRRRRQVPDVALHHPRISGTSSFAPPDALIDVDAYTAVARATEERVRLTDEWGLLRGTPDRPLTGATTAFRSAGVTWGDADD